MRTVRTKVYQFNELNDEAKQLAIENRKLKLVIDLSFFKDEAIEKIENEGFCNVNLGYSFNHCQGDGLSFSCGITDDALLKLFNSVLGAGKEKTAKIIMDYCSFQNNGNTGRYCYASENDLEYELESNGKPNVTELITKIEKTLKTKYYLLCKELEKLGYDEIDYQYLDETISEYLSDNDNEYLFNGREF